MSLVQSTRIASLYTPLGKDTLVLESLGASEQLGRLSSFEITAGSEKGDIKADSLLGKSVSVELKCPRGGTRFFHGYVSRFSRTPRSGRRYFSYHLAVVPWLWFLTRHSDCCIFQHKTLQDILREVFARHGFTDFKFNLTGNYSPWEYCVQYRETDFNFISRLLEQEGVYYYFEHAKDKHTVVFADSPSAHQPFPRYERLTFRAAETTYQHDDEHIFDWTAEGRHHTGRYLHTDYDFTRPKVDLKSPSAIPGNFAHASFEIYDYPGEYDKHGDGEQWSRVRMEELRADQETFQGGGDVTGLACGHKFTLAEPPSPADAGSYVITSTSIHLQSNTYETGALDGAGESYHCTFTVIKANHQFRPARLTPKPIVHGVQTAVVTGPKGEEVYVDDHARVKVQFHWDRYGKRDENSSCWVRVSQAWAGKGYGFISHPRIGQEVIVDFEEGDPDRPIITGRVYNADQKQHTPNAGRDGKPGNVKPTSQPQTKMMTSFKSNSLGGSGGYNEIAMNDTAGAEGLFFKAQKDEIHKVGNNREDTVGNNETRKVAMDRSREVGNNEKIEVGGNQTITVGSNKTETIAIASTETVGAAKALSVGAAYVVTVAGGMNTAVGLVQFEEVGLSKTVIVGTTFSLQAADEIILQTGMSTIRMLKNGKIEISGTDITLKSGEGKINIDPGGVVTLIGPVVKINPDETNF